MEWSAICFKERLLQGVIMNKFERYSVEHYLTDYPEFLSFDEIIELIKNESDDVAVWEPFEYYSSEEIIGFILAMKRSLMNLLEIKS